MLKKFILTAMAVMSVGLRADLEYHYDTYKQVAALFPQDTIAQLLQNSADDQAFVNAITNMDQVEVIAILCNFIQIIDKALRTQYYCDANDGIKLIHRLKTVNSLEDGLTLWEDELDLNQRKQIIRDIINRELDGQSFDGRVFFDIAKIFNPSNVINAEAKWIAKVRAEYIASLLLVRAVLEQEDKLSFDQMVTIAKIAHDKFN